MRWPLFALGLAAIAALDAPSAARVRRRAPVNERSACEGNRPPLPDALFFNLRSGAFPSDDGDDVAVHVPRGFDATRRPGAVAFFHGWRGCVRAALSTEDVPCTPDGDPRPGMGLAAELDAARVNALLIAIELRVDRPTGEPGELAMPGGFRALLHELFREHLAEPLGCELQVERLDRLVVVAHSGGYQAAAGALEFGDVPEIAEVDLLDAYYGADEPFSAWATSAIAHFDPRLGGPRRFVDLYTCCGGTLSRSRALSRVAAQVDRTEGFGEAVYDDDGEGDLTDDALRHAVVFKRVPRAHSDLPTAYLRPLLANAGFAPLQP